MPHEFESFTYLNLNGRIKKTLKHPRRERVLVRKALHNLGITYREMVVFRNPLYHGWKGKAVAAPQWLDFCIFQERMYVLLFDLHRGISGVKKYEREGDKAKKLFLRQKGIAYKVIGRKETSQVYEFIIRTFLRKERNAK